MFFFFKNKKGKEQKEPFIEPLDEILDGEITPLNEIEVSPVKKEKLADDAISDIEVIDLDEPSEEKDNVAVSLATAYEKLGITDIPPTEATVKQIYYEKRQEIRTCQFSKKNRRLLELKDAYELIMAHPEELKEDDTTDEFDDMWGDIPDFPAKEDENKAEREDAEEELFSWDEMMDEVDTEYKQKRIRKKKRITTLSALGIALLVIGIAGYIDFVKNKDFAEFGENEALQSVYSEPLHYDRDNQIIFNADNEIQIVLSKAYYLPIIQLNIQKLEVTYLTDDVCISTAAAVIYKANTSEEEPACTPIKTIYYNTEMQLQLEGVWSGAYKAGRENTSVSQLTIEITSDETGNLTGVCEIETDNGKQGSYLVDIEYEVGESKVMITGKEWINKPTFFIMSDFNAYYNMQNSSLLPLKESGPVFELTKEQ